MADQRIEKMARVLVDYSINVQPGDKVMIEATTAAEPLVRSLYKRVLERGGLPHTLLNLPDQEEILFSVAKPEQLEFPPEFHRYAAEHFDARIRVYSETNTRALTHVDPVLQGHRAKGLGGIQRTAMQRSAEGSFRWMSTQFPTEAYAQEAEMGLQAWEDFVYRSCHCDDNTPDPVAYWEQIRKDQDRFIRRFKGGDQVHLTGPNVDLTLSIKDRIVKNSCGINNMPDGEIYTGPIENTANGWVRFTYPAVFGGRVVEGVELHFENGRVERASAQKDEAFLLRMLDTDAGARYLGEFAIGTNFEIDRFSKNILYDEKIGGSFHLALGASYPDTGGKNLSAIHWDMICDMRQAAEIRLDGDVIYRNGKFLID